MEGVLWLVGIVATNLVLGWAVSKTTNKNPPLTPTQRKNLGLMIKDMDRYKIGGE
mgnify:CR=1 FL=1